MISRELISPEKQSFDPDTSKEIAVRSNQLVDDFKSGNQDAFQGLWEMYHGKVYGFALKRLGNIHGAEDITANIFLKIFVGLAIYENKGNPFEAWVMRIARNEIITHTRRSKIRGDLEDEIPMELATNESVEDEAEKNIEIDRVISAVDLLPDAQRDVIKSRFIDDLSLRETAISLGKQENNIKALQNRAVDRLRFILSSEPQSEKANNLTTIDSVHELVAEGDLTALDMSWLLNIPVSYVYSAIANLRRVHDVNIVNNDGVYSLAPREE